MTRYISNGLIFWLPRIIAITYILFLGLFALDVFIPNQTFGYNAMALFMHLIPNFILVAILLLSWKNEKIGGILFILAFFVMLLTFWGNGFWLMQCLLFSPLLIIGLLFIFCYNQIHEHV